MVDSSKKLPNDHAHNAQSFCSANQTLELFEHGVQTGTLADLESLPCKLIELFAQGSASQSAVSSASAVLQSADEMKVAELHDPTLGCTQPDNSRNLVGDRGPDASAYVSRDGLDGLRPTAKILSAGQKQRIEEDGSILMARLDRHHVQDPILPSKAEVKSVQDQDQRSSWQSNTPRSRYELAQLSTKTAAQSLPGKAVPRRDSFQCEPVQQNFFQRSWACPPRLAPSTFFSNSPRTLAMTALTASRTEVINFGSATWRFRVPRMHARELDTNEKSKS